MQQLQDKLNFPIDVISDAALVKKFEKEQAALESLKQKAAPQDTLQQNITARDRDTKPVRSQIERKKKRKAQRQARKLARA